MSQILIVWVSKNKLESFENNEKDPLSLEGLKHLLMKTLDTKAPFATSEFDIWKYALKKVISIVTHDRKTELSKCDADEFNEVKTHLTPFTYYIDLNRMDVDEIMKYIEPVNIFSIEKLKDIYCSKARDKELPNIRGIPVFKWKNSESEKQLIVSNDGYTVGMKPNNSNINLYWNLSTTEQNYHGWVLGSDGYVYRKNRWKWYDAEMKVGNHVTIFLDISTVDKRRKCKCSFSINGKARKPVVSGYGWDDIPSQVYPVVSLGCGSDLRIEPVSTRI
ncbi:12498_t:CDS:2 [Funneliformis mosseae]|uniref:12498_t:CDS:1 n=1 Tax=Funneliformis mosseae TaxID=27381 RepID=A0A9N9A3H7_FUNMO|nr:12498_t:CDS:2 [Funneliformis mosseae]